MTVNKRQQPTEKLERLRSLGDSPEGIAYAIRLLETEKSEAVAKAALKRLVDTREQQARPVLLERYQVYQRQAMKLDQGADNRTAILKALRLIAEPADIPFLEQASLTYEFLPPGPVEVGSILRATALVTLNEVDAKVASYYCVRLLRDPHTSKMSGEPALTAVRMLASHANYLALYDLLLTPPTILEVYLAVCNAVRYVPERLLMEIIEKYRASENDVLLVGLFDVIFNHPSPATRDFMIDFLKFTKRLDVYRYVVTTITADRHTELLAPLVEMARLERNKEKAVLLADALSLVRGDKEIEALVVKLRSKAN